MSILEKINSSYLLNFAFSYIGNNSKLKLIKVNKSLQKRCFISLFDYQDYYFRKNIKIEQNFLLDYYQFLKRCYSKNYPLKIIQKYYIEFFCKFLKENNIDFILNASHELAIDILLSKYLEKIKIIIYLENYKKNCIENYNLCQALFNNPKVEKLIIMEKENKRKSKRKKKRKENIIKMERMGKNASKSLDWFFPMSIDNDYDYYKNQYRIERKEVSTSMDRIFFNNSDEKNDFDEDNDFDNSHDIENNDDNDNDNDNDYDIYNDIDEANSNFRSILINNCIKYLPNIQTNDILLLNSLNLQKNIFKSIELIIPLENPSDYYNIKKLEGISGFKIIINEKPFHIKDLENIYRYELNKLIENKDLYLNLIIDEDENKKLDYLKDKINFNEIKKLELLFKGSLFFHKKRRERERGMRRRGRGGRKLVEWEEYRERHLKNVELLFKGKERERGMRRRGRGGRNLGEWEENENDDEVLNIIFQKYPFLEDLFDKGYGYNGGYDGDKYFHNQILDLLEKSPFESLVLSNGEDYKQGINKKENSIDLSLSIESFENFEPKFLKRLSYYERVNLKVGKFCGEGNCNYWSEKQAYLFKYDIDSKVKYFSFYFIIGKMASYFDDYCFFYNLEFPINFENLITLKLEYNAFISNNITIKFPLTEYFCDNNFPNLKCLSLYMYLDIKVIDKKKEIIIQNLSNNLKFCQNLEILNIKYKFSIDDIKNILKGITILKHLKEFSLNEVEKEYSFEEERGNKISEINEDEFYKYFPEYINYCPFLNKIKIQIYNFNYNDLIFEKNIKYKTNDIIIKNYKYVETLSIKKSFSTYLCNNEINKKVVLRKFKKSRINDALKIFEDEKKYLKKFKNIPYFINYIEFLEDEHYEYIIYEYIENVISKSHYKHEYELRPIHPDEYYIAVSRKIIILVEKFFNFVNNNEKILSDFIKNSDVLITENLDVIFQGFLYLNHYEENDYFIKRSLRYVNADIFKDDYYDSNCEVKMDNFYKYLKLTKNEGIRIAGSQQQQLPKPNKVNNERSKRLSSSIIKKRKKRKNIILMILIIIFYFNFNINEKNFN